MQAEKQQSWKIYIHAKAKNFHFKLKVRATNIVPTWELHRCSIVLKLGKYLLKLKSNHGTALIPTQKQPKTLKSKVLALLKKFRFRRSNNRAIGFKQKSDLSNREDNRMGWFAYKEPICMGSLFAGILAFLVQSISNKDQRAIVIHGSVTSLYLAFLFKKYMTRRIGNFLVLLVVCSLVLELDNCLRFDYLQMAWDYLVSSGLPDLRMNLIFLWYSCLQWSTSISFEGTVLQVANGEMVVLEGKKDWGPLFVKRKMFALRVVFWKKNVEEIVYHEAAGLMEF